MIVTMSNEPTVWLSYDRVLNLHDATLQIDGGAPGVRDEGALDSAINQPRASFGGNDLYPAIEEKAAALGFSLIKNHPFADGNKRTGLLAMHTFLELNGYYLASDPDETEFFILCVAVGEASRDDLVQWVRDWMEPIP